GIELSSFDADFNAWMRERMSEWGRLPEQEEAYVAVVRRGEAALQERDLPAAVEAFEAARKLRPMDEQPMRRLAGLYLASGTRDEARALEMLLALHERTDRDNRFAKTAARLLIDKGETERAQGLAYDAVQIAPYDRAAHSLLLEAARATGDTETVTKQERRLAVLAGMAVGR